MRMRVGFKPGYKRKPVPLGRKKTKSEKKTLRCEACFAQYQVRLTHDRHCPGKEIVAEAMETDVMYAGEYMPTETKAYNLA